MRSEDLAAAM